MYIVLNSHKKKIVKKFTYYHEKEGAITYLMCVMVETTHAVNLTR